MKVFLIKEKKEVKATGNFDPVTKELTVLKGSILSETIAYSSKFRGAKSVEKRREGVLKGNVLQKDILFKSPSTAANFVTGNSTNGLIAWKNNNGKSIKELIAEGEI